MNINKNFLTSNPNAICPSGGNRVFTEHSNIISTELLEKINSFSFIGVYQIGSKQCDEILYIGSSVDIAKRIHQIISGIINDNAASNPQLRQHCREYGIDDLDITILETVEFEDYNEEHLKERERFYITEIMPNFNSIISKKGMISSKYSIDTIPYQVYVNSKILNEFGNSIITKSSIDYKTGLRIPRVLPPHVDEKRKNWKPSYAIYDFDRDIMVITRGDIIVKKEVVPVSTVVRNVKFI